MIACVGKTFYCYKRLLVGSQNLKKIFRRQIFSHADCREVVSGTLLKPQHRHPPGEITTELTNMVGSREEPDNLPDQTWSL